MGRHTARCDAFCLRLYASVGRRLEVEGLTSANCSVFTGSVYCSGTRHSCTTSEVATKMCTFQLLTG
jgi:hypothetical protein